MHILIIIAESPRLILHIKKYAFHFTTFFIKLILGMVYFLKGHKHPKMVVGAYEFMLERRSSDKSVWCCTFKNRQKCRARCFTYGKIVNIRNEIHNHEPGEIADHAHLIPQHCFFVRHNERVRNDSF